MSVCYEGVVRKFNASKGYGFIECADFEKHVFVHYSQIVQEGYKELKEGQTVSFEVTKTPKGNQAVSVRVLGDFSQ